METSDAVVILIEKYLAGKLTLQESADFEESYQNDAEFAAEVDAYKEARKAIDVFAEQEMKAQFKKRFYESDSVKKRPLFVRRSYLMAAIISLLVLTVAALIYLNQPTSPQELYAANYQKENLAWTRSIEGDSAIIAFEQANRLYNQGQYDAAIPILENILADPDFSRRPFALLHLGLSQLEAGNEQDAINALSSVPEDSPFSWKAKWYMALVQLKQGNISAAKTLLEQVSDSKEYGDRAREILDDL